MLAFVKSFAYQAIECCCDVFIQICRFNEHSLNWLLMHNRLAARLIKGNLRHSGYALGV